MEKIKNNIYLKTGTGFSSNIYALKNGKKWLLIDAGDGSVEVEVNPNIVILTHGHFDHTRGVKEGWKAFLHHADININKNLYYTPTSVSKIDFERITFGKFELQILHTPGHTPGSICIYEKMNRVLFSGDTLFANGFVGRTNSKEDEKKLFHSINKIKKTGYVLLCPGHGSIEKRFL